MLWAVSCASRSMTSVLLPFWAHERAQGTPPVPKPHTSTSVSSVSVMSDSAMSGAWPSQSGLASAVRLSWAWAGVAAMPAEAAAAMPAAAMPAPATNPRRVMSALM